MSDLKIPKRISTALVNSLGSGVTPRVGLEYMAVGRKPEIETLLGDLANISEGGSVFRFIVGRYGSGKSFLLQIIRNYAMERNYVVTDADLSPERKLTGNKGNGLATFRELMQNLSTRVRPDGGAISSILEKWMSTIQMSVMKDLNIAPSDPQFSRQVEMRTMEAIHNMDSMVHGFDFAKVLSMYFYACRNGSDEQKNSALKWLRGEYSTKTEAHADLGVRVIIDDDTWFDYIKLLSAFVRELGYAGLVMLIDEGVNLYKISNPIARSNNYEKLLMMFNDAMQGRAMGLGIYMGGTPQFIEDNRRGLFSYEALRTRLAASRFLKDGVRDMQSPLIYLDKLTHEEIFVLLKKILDIHTQHYEYSSPVTEENLLAFMQVVASRIGADELLTPREIIRDFIGILNVMRQNPAIEFEGMLTGDLFKTARNDDEKMDDDDSDSAVFTL